MRRASSGEAGGRATRRARSGSGGKRPGRGVSPKQTRDPVGTDPNSGGRRQAWVKPPVSGSDARGAGWPRTGKAPQSLAVGAAGGPFLTNSIRRRFSLRRPQPSPQGRHRMLQRSGRSPCGAGSRPRASTLLPSPAGGRRSRQRDEGSEGRARRVARPGVQKAKDASRRWSLLGRLAADTLTRPASPSPGRAARLARPCGPISRKRARGTAPFPERVDHRLRPPEPP